MSVAIIPEIERKATLSADQVIERRRAMDADVWLFIKWVCGHGAEDIERFHRPLAYMLAGDAVRLAASLNTYESEVVEQIQKFCADKGIDWNTKAGIYRLRKHLERVNDRITRSIGKTLLARDVLLHAASVDPNQRILIVSKSDEAAWGMCEAIGNMMRTPEYQTYYHDRIYPANPDSCITRKWIRLNGRTMAEQETIEARGVTSQSYSRHYGIIYGDDMSSTEAKQGEATIEDANRFIASMHGLSLAERYGGTRFIFNGTIQGARDDNATLSIPQAGYLSTRIPIWRHPRGAEWNFQNLHEDGIPVLKEMYDIDACRKKRDETVSNPKLGPISWLQNFCLTPADEYGSMQFSAELLRRAKFVWVYKRSIGSRGQEKVTRFIRRYLWTVDDGGNRIPKVDPKLPDDHVPCKCHYDGPHKQHAYLDFDPLSLPRMLGVDQAVTGKGDKWSIAAGCQDPLGFKYALKGKAGRGRGYVDLINAIPMVFNQWGGRANPPRKVGIESNAAQVVTADWLQRAEEFSFLARRVEKVSPGTMAKEMRIFNSVLANLEMGTLLLDPEDHDRDTEMLGYNSSIEDPEDDILDSIAIMVTLFGQPSGESDEETVASYARDQQQQYARDCDPATGVDVMHDPMEYMWN